MSLMTIVSMTPLGKGESVSRHVVKVVDVIDRSGIPYVTTPMGTIIEGDTWDDVMEVIKKCFQAITRDCTRVSVFMKIDYRKGKAGRIKSKIDSLEAKLNRNLPRSS